MRVVKKLQRGSRRPEWLFETEENSKDQSRLLQEASRSLLSLYYCRFRPSKLKTDMKVGDQGYQILPPQNMPLWYTGYFKL